MREDSAAALARADRQVLEGCYDCLLAARETYVGVAVGKARPLVVLRLFETELLLALREKSLAMDPGPALERARALLPELPVAIEAPRLVAAVAAVPADSNGTPVVERRAFEREHRPFQAEIEPTLVWLDRAPFTPAVRRAMALAIDCGHPIRTPPAGSRRTAIGNRPEVAPDAPPLVAYEAASCRQPDRVALDAVRAAVPGFVETSFGLVRLSLLTARSDGGPGAREGLTELHARFPTSAGTTYLFGNYNQLVGDCRAALRYYDETIVLKPLHEDAHLGRVICLSYLKRSDEAIAAATHMVGLSTYNVDQAYYWRAWNHHLLKDLPTARRDIESAKAIASSGEIFTLAGIIEHDQDDLTPSERDLKAARAAAYGSRNCAAAWYLGLVKMKRQTWLESSDWFESAMTCYEANIAESEAGLRQMEGRTDIDPAFKARQIAGFEAALKEDRSQYHAAAFNAANQGARGGRIDRARVLLEVAAQDAGLSTLVEQLRAILKGK